MHYQTKDTIERIDLVSNSEYLPVTELPIHYWAIVYLQTQCWIDQQIKKVELTVRGALTNLSPDILEEQHGEDVETYSRQVST